MHLYAKSWHVGDQEFQQEIGADSARALGTLAPKQDIGTWADDVEGLVEALCAATAQEVEEALQAAAKHIGKQVDLSERTNAFVEAPSAR